MQEEMSLTKGRGLLELIRSDVDAWRTIWSQDADQHPRSGVLDDLRMIYSYVGLRVSTLYRISHALHVRGIRLLPQMLSRVNLMLHGFDVPASVEIGARLYIPHPVGTVIMAERIGSGLTLVSGVTIGMRNERGFPTLGDDVFIGAGARVLGRICIGNHVKIGANAVVVEDVPDNCVAVGVPARIHVPGAAAVSTQASHNGTPATKIAAPVRAAARSSGRIAAARRTGAKR